MAEPPYKMNRCWIYRSSNKDQMYLYLAAEDAFDSAPVELMQTFGTPVLVMQLLLDSDKALAREDIQTVMQNLAENGWHLQMPPHTHPDSCQHA